MQVSPCMCAYHSVCVCVSICHIENHISTFNHLLMKHSWLGAAVKDLLLFNDSLTLYMSVLSH